MVTPAAVPAAMVSGKCMLIGAVMVRCSNYVALTIMRLVSVEMVERLLSALRQRSVVSVMRVITIVDVTVKSCMAVKPRTCTDKDTAHKPVGSIVSIRCAVIRCIVKVTIGANRRHSDANHNLRFSWGRHAQQCHRKCCEY